MKEHFAERLENLRRRLILMGSEVEKQIRSAIEALTEGSVEKARTVIARDEDIDRLENQIEEETIQLLALEQPVAIDLRFLVAVLKINNDLERIGDHAVNIAEGAVRLAGKVPFQPAIGLRSMSEMVQRMLRESLDAFIARDAALAKKVIQEDDAPGFEERGGDPAAPDLHGRDAGSHLTLARAHLGFQEPRARGRPRDEHRRGHHLHRGSKAREAPRRGARRAVKKSQGQPSASEAENCAPRTLIADSRRLTAFLRSRRDRRDDRDHLLSGHVRVGHRDRLTNDDRAVDPNAVLQVEVVHVAVGGADLELLTRRRTSSRRP